MFACFYIALEVQKVMSTNYGCFVLSLSFCLSKYELTSKGYESEINITVTISSWKQVIMSTTVWTIVTPQFNLKNSGTLAGMCIAVKGFTAHVRTGAQTGVEEKLHLKKWVNAKLSMEITKYATQNWKLNIKTQIQKY